MAEAMKQYGILTLLIAAGCSSGGLAHRVDNAIVTKIPADARQPIDVATKEEADAREGLTAATTDLGKARYELMAAQLNAAVSALEVDSNEQLMATAQVDDPSRIEELKKVGARLALVNAASTTGIEFAASMVKYREIGLEVASARVVAAEAKLEAARAEAAASTNVAPLDVAAFKEQLASLNSDVASLEEDAASQWRDVEEAKAAHEEAKKQVPVDQSAAAQ